MVAKFNFTANFAEPPLFFFVSQEIALVVLLYFDIDFAMIGGQLQAGVV